MDIKRKFLDNRRTYNKRILLQVLQIIFLTITVLATLGLTVIFKTEVFITIITFIVIIVIIGILLVVKITMDEKIEELDLKYIYLWTESGKKMVSTNPPKISESVKPHKIFKRHVFLDISTQRSHGDVYVSEDTYIIKYTLSTDSERIWDYDSEYFHKQIKDCVGKEDNHALCKLIETYCKDDYHIHIR